MADTEGVGLGRLRSGTIGCNSSFSVCSYTPPSCKSAPNDNKASIAVLVSSDVAGIVSVSNACSVEVEGATELFSGRTSVSSVGLDKLSSVSLFSGVVDCEPNSPVVVPFGCASGDKLLDLLAGEVPGGLLVDD